MIDYDPLEIVEIHSFCANFLQAVATRNLEILFWSSVSVSLRQAFWNNLTRLVPFGSQFVRSANPTTASAGETHEIR